MVHVTLRTMGCDHPITAFISIKEMDTIIRRLRWRRSISFYAEGTMLWVPFHAIRSVKYDTGTPDTLDDSKEEGDDSE